MSRKRNRPRRAGEWLYGSELEEQYAPNSESKRADFEQAKKGIFPSLETHFLRLASAVENEYTAPAKSSILQSIARAQELLLSFPMASEEHLESDLSDYARLLAWECLMIGSEAASAHFEFGANGGRIGLEKEAESARTRGGESQKNRTLNRDRQIREKIVSHLAEGSSYAVALKQILDQWDPRWGKEVSLGRLRNRFAKKSFTSQRPREN